MAPTTTRPSNQPRTKTGPRERALEEVRRTTTAMIGMGLNATPIASGRECPIASPMPPPPTACGTAPHHDLDVTVVTRVVLGDVAAPGDRSSRADGPCHVRCACHIQVAALAVAAMGLR